MLVLRTIFGGPLRNRTAAQPANEDILSAYMNYIDPDTSEPFPLNELGAEALLLFGAGRPASTFNSLVC